MKCRYGIACNICELKQNRGDLSFCPRIQNIDKEIDAKVVQPALLQKSLLSSEQFNQFVDKQVGAISKELIVLQNTINEYNGKSDEYACSWNFCYHWGLAFIRTLNSMKEENPAIEPNKSEKLFEYLCINGFFELGKIKCLSEENQKELVRLLQTTGIPYSMAMFEYVGFLQYIHKERVKSKKKMYSLICGWFGCTERQIKGNVLVLNEKSKENRTRYTAHTYKEQVEKEYKQLK